MPTLKEGILVSNVEYHEVLFPDLPALSAAAERPVGEGLMVVVIKT